VAGIVRESDVETVRISVGFSMLMVLRQWRWALKFVLLTQALIGQFMAWLVFLGRNACGVSGNDPRTLLVLVASPLGTSRGVRRTRFAVKVPSTRPARLLLSTPCPPLTVPFSE